MATHARCAVDADKLAFLRHGDGPPGAGVHTAVTPVAFLRGIGNFPEGIDPLWVGAPFAPQGTPLHEDGAPDPGAVVDGVTLYVEYQAFRGVLGHVSYWFVV